jgi:serine/threonine protein kinase
MQPLRDVSDPFIGTTVHSELRPGVVYRIERTLGEGGTARAYFASRFGPEGTSPVVMKVIQPIVIQQAGERARMVVQKEAVALGRINERVPPCPFVVRLLDTGSVEWPGRGPSALQLPWLALEYVHGGPDGATLEERVQKSIADTGSAFTPERALKLLEQATEGLAEIHAAGVIHRDLNPNNILCCGTGNSEMFKISDFGIARPLGMSSTFGSGMVGTPGYIAPEQVGDDDTKTEFRADIFGLGALLFFALTGEDLFQAPNFMGMVMIKNRERRSIRTAATLAPEIRADEEVCTAIDRAIALATSNDPELRPNTPKAFAASFKPWLTSCPPTRRTALPLPSAQALLPAWAFSVRHPAEESWILLQIGWDSDGHCLATTTDGLAYFDGTRWSEVSHQTLGGIRPVRFVTSAGTGRWLVGGDGAVIAEYSRAGVTRLLRGDDPSLTLGGASGDLGDLACAVATRPGSPPLLCGISGGRWLKPLPVPNAASLTTLARLDETRWLVGGRGTDGRGFAGIYAPLRWELEALPRAETRAWLCATSRPEREVSMLVGSHGAVLRRERGDARVGYLPTPVDLASSAIDVLGRAWVGGAGELWMAASPEASWQRLWSSAEWRAPFVSIFADAGFVFAATAEGAILEGRATGVDRVSGPAPKR